jgi:hypothetical protein
MISNAEVITQRSLIMSEEITRCEQTCREIQSKLQRAQVREEQISAQSRALGYEVHVEGKSRKALDSLISDQAGLKIEIDSLTGALDVANRNLTSAKAAVNRAADEAKAQELLALADQFDAEAHKLGEAADALISACTAIAALHTRAYGLNAQRPSRQQLDIMVGRVIATALMRAGVQQQTGTSFLAPADRKTADVLYQYADIIRTDANARIAGENREAA